MGWRQRRRSLYVSFIHCQEQRNHLTKLNSVVYTGDTREDHSWSLSQTVSVCPDKDYVLNFWMMNFEDIAVHDCDITACFATSSGTNCASVGTQVASDSGTWYPYTRSYSGSSAQQVILSIEVNQCSLIWMVDAVSFTTTSN
jgi:hypothetical protein